MKILVQLLILLTIVIPNRKLLSGGELIIASYPSPLNVILGNAFTLSCIYRPYTFHSWVHPTSGVIYQSTGHLTLNIYAGGFSNLIVNTTTFSDQGEYVCHVRNGSDALLSQSITATLFERVNITTPTMLSYEARLCERVALRCEALNHESLTWTKTSEHGFSSIVTNSSDRRILTLSNQLLIHETKLSDNGTYICVARNRVIYDYITANLYVAASVLQNLLPPQNITLKISSKERVPTSVGFDHLVNLSFMWTPPTSETSCSIQYDVNASNCGSCPNSTVNTSAVCEVTELTPGGQLCVFIVQAVIHENIVSPLSGPYIIKLRVPDTPVIECKPEYSFNWGNLMSIHTTIINNSTFESEVESVSAVMFYTFVYTDSVTGQICDSDTIPSSSCDSPGRCSHLYLLLSSSCSLSSYINVTAFGVNLFGRGDSSDPSVIKSTNDFLEVAVDYPTDSVYCNSLLYTSEIETCSIHYGFSETQTKCQESQNSRNSLSLSSQNVTLSISNLSQNLLWNQEFCFLVAATFNDSLTVLVKGSFNLLRIAATQITEAMSTVSDHERIIKHTDSQSQGITITITTVCLIMFILVMIVMVTIVIVVIIKKRLGSSVAILKRSRNSGKSTDMHRNSKVQEAGSTNDNDLIYADVVTCSSKVNMVLDDDRVEYAEIERTVNGEPLTKTSSTTNMPTRCHSEPLNLDTLLIKIQSQVTPKWSQFGAAVGIERSVLEKYSSYPDEVCIVEVVDYWLRNHPTKPTWRDVGEALKKIELHQLGDEILMLEEKREC